MDHRDFFLAMLLGMRKHVDKLFVGESFHKAIVATVAQSEMLGLSINKARWIKIDPVTGRNEFISQMLLDGLQSFILRDAGYNTMHYRIPRNQAEKEFHQVAGEFAETITDLVHYFLTYSEKKGP